MFLDNLKHFFQWLTMSRSFTVTVLHNKTLLFVIKVAVMYVCI